MKFSSAFSIVFVAFISGCSGYGDYEVASRKEVDFADLPNLDDVPWRNVDFEVAISSELHAKIVPEVEWTGPIGNLISRLPGDKRRNLEQTNWDLPIRDRCLYVNLDGHLRTWRIQHRGRTLFLAIYPYYSIDEFGERERGYQLAVIDESKGMRRYDFAIFGPNIRVLALDDRIAIFQEQGSRIVVQNLVFRGGSVVFGDVAIVVESPLRFRFWNIALGPDGMIHVAWSSRAASNISRSPAFYAPYEGRTLTPDSSQKISRSVTGRSIEFAPTPSSMFVVWLDSRFRSGFVGIRNASKLFVAEVETSSGTTSTPVVLTPPRASEYGASSPYGAVWANGQLLLFWSERITEGYDLVELKYASLSYEEREVAVAEGSVGGKKLLEVVMRQITSLQRANPIGNEPGPPASECDRWREILDSYPAKAWMMMPDGPSPMLIPRDKNSKEDPDG